MNMEYLSEIRKLLDHVEKNVAPVIEEVSEVCAKAIATAACCISSGQVIRT